MDPRDLLPRPRHVLLLPSGDSLQYGLAVSRCNLELHYDAAHVRERRSLPACHLASLDAGDCKRQPRVVLVSAGPRDRRLRNGGLVVPWLPRPVRDLHARRGDGCCESLLEGRVRSEVGSSGSSFPPRAPVPRPGLSPPPDAVPDQAMDKLGPDGGPPDEGE